MRQVEIHQAQPHSLQVRDFRARSAHHGKFIKPALVHVLFGDLSLWQHTN